MSNVSIGKSHLKAFFELYASIFQNIPVNKNLGDAIFRTIGTKTKRTSMSRHLASCEFCSYKM